MSTSQKPGGGLSQSLNVRMGTSRRMARMESGTAPPASARREFHISEQVGSCSADRENMVAIRLAKLQSAMLLKGRLQDRDHHVEPFAAHPIRRLPQRRQRFLDRRTVSAATLSRCLDPVRPNRLVLPERAHRMLAMPARRRAQRVEDLPLLRPLADR
jgi:hypothetical protein